MDSYLATIAKRSIDICCDWQRFVEATLEDAHQATARDFKYSMTAMACARLTPGKSSRNSSMVEPVSSSRRSQGENH
jgi:hypothetical protein